MKCLGEGKDKLATGMDMHTLLYIKQVTSKHLLHSTRNSTQYSAMAFVGKELKKGWICVYVSLIRSAVRLKLML